jgi:hypothetical protein
LLLSIRQQRVNVSADDRLLSAYVTMNVDLQLAVDNAYFWGSAHCFERPTFGRKAVIHEAQAKGRIGIKIVVPLNVVCWSHEIALGMTGSVSSCDVSLGVCA